ncbi:hypothetical protein V6N12_047497 [Hibiscus sabdariffa]|uniref:Uncharacterized protein n=1 Tax=Hibiscus sabdariffa TaxID=183260 RepID=A0ABR2DB16_9ROSI
MSNKTEHRDTKADKRRGVETNKVSKFEFHCYMRFLLHIRMKAKSQERKMADVEGREPSTNDRGIHEKSTKTGTRKKTEEEEQKES